MISMTLNDLALAVDKVHEAFYKEKAKSFNKDIDHVINLIYSDENIKVDNSISPKRFRLTFKDYEGKIDEYNNLFGEILKNAQNACDTGYLIDLPYTHAKKIFDYVMEKDLKDINKYRLY